MPAELSFIIIAALGGLLAGTLADPFVDSMYADPLHYSPFGRCVRCDAHLLPAGALAIVGYVRWRRRCPHCGAPFPARSILLPLAMAALFALTVVAYEDDERRIAMTMVFGAAALVLLWTDTERRVAPNRLIYPALALAAVAAPFWPQHDWWQPYLTAAALVAATGAARTWLGVGVGVGVGDVKFAALLGLTLAWPGALVAIAVAGIAASGALMVVLTPVSYPARQLPYSSMLAFGMLVALLWAEPLLSSVEL